jgi:DNA processing protein
MDKIYLAALHMIPGIGTARLKSLVDFFGTGQKVWDASKEDLLACNFLNGILYSKLLEIKERIDIEKLAAEWERKNIKICTLQDANYPSLLRNIFNPPFLLYYKGVLPENQMILAIVGSRKASAYGKNVARMLAGDLAAQGIDIVSGAARGIDSAAHIGALAKGHTIAVLGSGVDIIYPPENGKLLDKIAECGAVISEYPPGTLAHAGFFPARNRIINGLAKGVIVVEAEERSGALITAEYALEEGRDVFAVPGSIFSATSRGTHKLIKQGAKLVEAVNDVLEEYGLGQNAGDTKDDKLLLSSEEQAIYDILSYETPIEIEEIMIRSKLPVPTITYLLLQLELRGIVSAQNGQFFVRTAREGIR